MNWANNSPAENYEALTRMMDRMQVARREGLRGKVDEVLANLPDGAMVAVSPPEVGPPDSGVVAVFYTIRPLLPGMLVPDGWTLYCKAPAPMLPPCP